MDAVSMHDPFNGNTERIAANVKAWNEKMHPCPDKDDKDD